MKGKSAVELVTLMLSLLFSDARCSVEMRQVVLPNDNWSYNYSMSCINESTSCQPWSVCNASLDVCKCFQLSGDSLICNEIAQNKLIPSILDCNCVTLDEDNERQMVEVGKCIYNCVRDQNNPYLIYQQLPDNLSNIKFFSICFDILTPVKVYQFYSPLQVNSSWRLYYDPTIKYFSKEHRWYAIIALVIAFVFIIIPLLVLFLYSTRVFHKFFSILPQRWQLFLHVFVDSIQGCYKDGTEPGTRDCRWYVPMLYILRFLIMFIYGLTLNAAFFPYGVMMITIFVVMTILIDIFKSSLKYLSSSILIFLLLIGSFFVSNIGAIMADEESNTITSSMFYLLTVTMSSLPLIYVAIIAIHWISSHLCLRNKIRELVSGIVI